MAADSALGTEGFEITGNGELAVKNSMKLAGNVLDGLLEIGEVV